MPNIFEDDKFKQFLDGEDHDGYEIDTPSGAKFWLATEGERDYFTNRATQYMNQNKFTNVADIQDLDRVLLYETMIWRWGRWLSQEKDYWNNTIDVESLKRHIASWSQELRLIKKQLGIDKVGRDRERGTSVEDYLRQLRERAKKFGYMRQEQLTQALTLFNELDARVTLYLNCDEQERKEQNITVDELIGWIVNECLPKYRKVDEYFQKNEQQTWSKEL